METPNKGWTFKDLNSQLFFFIILMQLDAILFRETITLRHAHIGRLYRHIILQVYKYLICVHQDFSKT